MYKINIFFEQAINGYVRYHIYFIDRKIQRMKKDGEEWRKKREKEVLGGGNRVITPPRTFIVHPRTLLPLFLRQNLPFFP